jgi:hypothetical protein
MEMLGDETAPLVLAGGDYLLPIYQQANSYPYLIEKIIKGNPDQLDVKVLHQQAWRFVEPIFGADLRQALARYQELNGSNSEVSYKSLKSIVPAIHFGRVEAPFVAQGIQLWGNFDASKNNLAQHKGFRPDDQDLLDLVAVQTLLNGGEVYALEPAKMPNEAPLAAMFRTHMMSNTSKRDFIKPVQWGDELSPPRNMK